MLECQCNLLCCHVHPQIFQHLRYTTVKDQQVWIVRILFIIPIYGLCSWFGLWITNGSVYFDAVRGCYEGRISLCNVPSLHSDFVHAFVVSVKPYMMQTIDGLWFGVIPPQMFQGCGGLLSELVVMLQLLPSLTAFVIYNFLRLCMAYVGGEMAILAEINGKPVE